MKQLTNSSLKQFFFALICVALISGLILVYIGERARVNGASMETTLKDGDSVMVDKISYRFSEPERFDIIVFKADGLNDELFIKRIIALPGETIQIKNGHIYINDKLLKSDTYSRELTHYAGIADESITLQDDEYFCLGDNRNNSIDSRYETVGCVKKDEIIGKAFFRVLPLKEIGTIK